MPSSSPMATIKGLALSLRPAGWSKNLFVLAPLVFAQRLGDATSVARALAAFAAFCAAASAIYLINDLRDRDDDRHHPLKRLRPIAAGTVGPGLAALAAGVLALGAAAIAANLGPSFSAALATYVALNLLYIWKFKYLVILDVMSIALGFVLRVIGGGAVLAVSVSSWLLLCTTFLALFLGFSKRRHEIQLLAEGAIDQRRVLAHYSVAFLDQMINVVTASAVVCYALYAVAPETVDKFHTHRLVWTLPFVLFGVFRYLYLIYQQTAERRNPTEAILTDLPFLLNLLAWALSVVLVIYGPSLGVIPAEVDASPSILSTR